MSVSHHTLPRHGLLKVGVAAIVLTLALSGCAEIEEKPGSTYEPAKVGAADRLGVKQVTFTAEAARRVELKTVAAVRSGPHIVVPYAALIYDGQGESWVYTVSRPLTYLRAKVVVDKVEGDRVFLTSGPRVGTHVVTVGATEVYGAELDIAGSH